MFKVNKTSKNAYYKFIPVFCLALLIIGIWSAWNSPSTAYESSIYSSTPLIFWMGAIVNITAGVILTVLHLGQKPKTKDRGFPVVPFLLIFLSFAAVISLFIFRGYVLWVAGDPISHIGTIKAIIQSGHILKSNFYPITHIICSQISEITGISPYKLANIVPFIFTLLSVLFTYCLAKIVLRKTGGIVIALIFSMNFTGGWLLNLTPNHLSNFMFPFALYLILKYLSFKSFSWIFLFLISLFLFPVFHPIPGIILLIILISLPFFYYKFSRREDTQFSENTKKEFYFNKNITILYTVWTIVWFSVTYILGQEIKETYGILTAGERNQFEVLASQVNYAAGFSYNIPELFFKTYGGLLILLILSLITLIYIWKAGKQSQKQLFAFLGPLLLLLLSFLLFYAVNLGFSPQRLLVYIVMISSLFAAYILFELVLIAAKKHTRIVKLMINVSVIIVILGLFVLGGLKTYPSRYIIQPNNQVTLSDLSGMNWYFYNVDVLQRYTIISLPVYRFADLLLTQEEIEKRFDINPYARSVPYHFSQDVGNVLGDNYSRDLYLVVDQQDRRYYIDIVPEMAQFRYQPQDFIQLENDYSVSKIYSNEGFQTYYIRSSNPIPYR